MQVYRGMDIGTAKPTAAERARVPHHLVDILDIDAPFSAADFTVRAAAAARDVCARGRLPILAGGTGLYIELLLSGGPAPSAPADAGIREKYFAFARREGNEALWARLRALDPETAAAVHPNNVKRVVRALEIYELTGRTKSEQDRAGTSAEPLFDPFVVRLGGPREVIYARIDRRFDQMLGSGLLDEVRALYGAGWPIRRRPRRPSDTRSFSPSCAARRRWRPASKRQARFPPLRQAGRKPISPASPPVCFWKSGTGVVKRL